MNVSFTVPGRPVPKQRPRVYMSGRRAQVYTPRETREYEETVGWYARPRFKHPLLEPVRLAIRAFLRRGPGREPDATNVAKSVEDGMNTIAYQDDIQVKSLRTDLWFSQDERVDVCVEPLRRPLVEGEPWCALLVRIGMPPEVGAQLKARVAALLAELRSLGAEVEIEEMAG